MSISPTPTPNTRPKLWQQGTLTYSVFGLGMLCFWLLWGDVAWAMRDRSMPSIMQLLFRNFGASNLTIGLLISTLPQILILFSGPIISSLSDRHRGSHGRRIPFLLAHIPIAVSALLLAAASPWLGITLNRALGIHSPGLSICMLIFIGMGWSCFELAAVVANSVFYALINDVVPTALLGRFYGLFRAISLISSIIFNVYVFGLVEKHFSIIFIALAVLYGSCFLAMCLQVKEGEYPPPEPMKDGEVSFLPRLKLYFKNCFSNPYYLWVLLAIAAPSISLNAFNTYAVPFAKSLSMDMTYYGHCLAITYICSLVLSYPIGMLADHFHPLRTSLVALIPYAIVEGIGTLFATNQHIFSICFVLHGVFAGIWLTSAISLPMRLFPKLNFSQFFVATYMVTGLGIMSFSPLIGQFIDLTHEFYRLTFAAAFGFAILGILSGLVVYRKFVKLGGVKGYVAPE